MRLIALLPKTGDETEYALHRRVNTFVLDEKGHLQAATTDRGLQIEYDGQNIVVTDCGLPMPLRLVDLELTPQAPYVWALGQELHLGDYLLFVDRSPPSAPSRVRRFPRERMTPLLAVLLLLAVVLPIVWWFWSTETNARALIDQSKTPAAVTAPLTATLTAQASAVLPPVVVQATATALAKPMSTPTTIITTSLNAKDIFLTPAPTPTATLTATLGAANATPAPLPTVASTPRVWDLRLNATPEGLGVTFEPARVALGGQYYRLLEAEWLSEAESNGYHHIFVDVVDEQDQRLLGTYVIVSWSTGSCVRQIDPKPGILIKETRYFEYGADCPMFAAGSVYSVKVDGLPSDSVHNLGLGSPQQRDWALLTSFRLKFQRTTNKKPEQ